MSLNLCPYIFFNSLSRALLLSQKNMSSEFLAFLLKLFCNVQVRGMITDLQISEMTCIASFSRFFAVYWTPSHCLERRFNYLFSASSDLNFSLLCSWFSPDQIASAFSFFYFVILIKFCVGNEKFYHNT